jgi:hypothetical protein
MNKNQILNAVCAEQFGEDGKKKMSFRKAWAKVQAVHPEWFEEGTVTAERPPFGGDGCVVVQGGFAYDIVNDRELLCQPDGSVVEASFE